MFQRERRKLSASGVGEKEGKRRREEEKRMTCPRTEKQW